jgi:hypothetical protein
MRKKEHLLNAMTRLGINQNTFIRSCQIKGKGQVDGEQSEFFQRAGRCRMRLCCRCAGGAKSGEGSEKEYGAVRPAREKAEKVGDRGAADPRRGDGGPPPRRDMTWASCAPVSGLAGGLRGASAGTPFGKSARMADAAEDEVVAVEVATRAEADAGRVDDCAVVVAAAAAAACPPSRPPPHPAAELAPGRGAAGSAGMDHGAESGVGGSRLGSGRAHLAPRGAPPGPTSVADEDGAGRFSPTRPRPPPAAHAGEAAASGRPAPS